jgi:hypothetical protein
MADDAPPTGSIPEDLADDAPVDVDYNAVIARAQAHLVIQGGMAYADNADLRQKITDLAQLKAQA